MNATLAEMCDRVNRGCRSRTAALRVWPDEWEKPAALLRAGGAGVQKYYPGAATTTVAGIAWHTTAHGSRLVRINVKRAEAPKSTRAQRVCYPFEFWTRDQEWRRADPRAVVLKAHMLTAAAAEVRHAVASGMWGCEIDILATPVMALCVVDWLEEHDYPANALRDYVGRVAAHLANQAGRPWLGFAGR